MRLKLKHEAELLGYLEIIRSAAASDLFAAVYQLKEDPQSIADREKAQKAINRIKAAFRAFEDAADEIKQDGQTKPQSR